MPPETCLVKRSFVRQAGLASGRSENFWRASRVLCEAGPRSILSPLISGAHGSVSQNPGKSERHRTGLFIQQPQLPSHPI